MCHFKIKNSLYRLTTVIAILLTASCAPLNVDVGLSFDNDLIEDEDFSDFSIMFRKAGCQGFQSHVWDYIYKIVSIENGKPPPYHTVKEKVIERIEKLTENSSANKEDIRRFAMRFVEIYALVTEFMDQNKTAETTNTLVQLEHGIVEPDHTEFTNRLKQIFSDLDETAKALNQECLEEPATQIAEDSSSSREEEDQWNTGWLRELKKNTHPLVYGARKVMATA